MRLALLAGFGLGLAAFGCTIEPVRTAETATAQVICDVTRCGTNSPEIPSFHELNVRGLPNTQGLRVSGFAKNAIEYTPEVVAGRLRGHNATGTISGTGLVGAHLAIADEDGRRFAIIVAGVGYVIPWARVRGMPFPGLIERYDLRWTQLGTGQLEPICGDRVDGADTSSLSPGWAVLFEGDRINSELKTIDPIIDLDWFNIGCAGHVTAKLVLAGHTEAQKDHYQTTWEDRQALLKMLVGDYCGSGTSFTVLDHPLYWRDQRSIMTFVGTVRTPVEARWSSQGATCLGEPRLDANAPSQWPEALSSPVITDIQNACPALPRCTNGEPGHQDGAYLVSANPLL
jgi:hypothetical protein